MADHASTPSPGPRIFLGLLARWTLIYLAAVYAGLLLAIGLHEGRFSAPAESLVMLALFGGCMLLGLLPLALVKSARPRGRAATYWQFLPYVVIAACLLPMLWFWLAGWGAWAFAGHAVFAAAMHRADFRPSRLAGSSDQEPN